MSTITTILGTDQATNSRSVINTNFSNLNTDKYQSGDSPTFATTYSPILIGGTSTTSSLTYKTTTGVGTTGADHIFLVGNNGATEAMRILNNANVGIGVSSTSARLELRSTTAQLITSYNGSNYMVVTTASNGSTSFDVVGTNAELVMNDPVQANSTMRIASGLYMDSSFNILNKAANGFLIFATRNTAGADAVYDLDYIGTMRVGGSATMAAINYAADAQANDTYVITLAPAPVAYTTGMQIIFKANTANTGAATLNVNGLGAKTIVKAVSTTLANNDILASMLCLCVYDGTNFVLMNPRAL